uniref:Uncharacterized protein n=1 Tax=Solanum demissum TaxID=50514 RepID=Q0KIT9_SOLDE|nr:hypothetical protein SDM1_25t00002 [Solanum demissum]
MAVVGLDRFIGTGNPDDWIFRAERYFAYLGYLEIDWIPLHFLYLDGEALDWFRWMYRNKQFWDWKHFKENISNITGLSPIIVQEAAIEDAIDNAITRVSEEIASALGDGQSSIANNFELVVTDKFFSHEILISDFDEPIGVDGYISLIPHDDVAAIAEFFPFVFNQLSLADFGDLAMCETLGSMLTKYGHHVSATEFDKNGYRPIIGVQGSSILIFAIRCSCYYSSGDNSKIAWEGASHNWFLEMSRYILAMESGNSKMNQLFDAMSDKACKVFNVMSTSLLVRVLAETPKEMGTIQQFHFKDRMFTDFFWWSRIYSVGCTFHIRPTKEKIDLVASNNIYVDIIFMKFTIPEDVSKKEIQLNDVKHVKFNEGIRHDECLFPVNPGENLFMVKLGGTVKDNGWQVLVDVCALGAKNMPTLSVKPSSQIEPLGAWSDKNLTVEWIIKHQHVSTDQCAYWCLRIIYISTDEISFWVDTIVCPMNNINCMRAFECISVTSIVTCKWFNVVQLIEVVQGYSDNLQNAQRQHTCIL